MRAFRAGRRLADQRLRCGALIPPPFPFTPVVAGAAAFQYPQKKLLPLLAAARGARFVVIALLAHHYGRRLIRIIEAPAFRWFVIGLIALSVAGSVSAIYKWVRPGKKEPEPEPEPALPAKAPASD